MFAVIVSVLVLGQAQDPDERARAFRVVDVTSAGAHDCALACTGVSLSTIPDRDTLPEAAEADTECIKQALVLGNDWPR